MGVAKPTPVADPVDLADPSVDVNDPIPVGVVDPPPMGVGLVLESHLSGRNWCGSGNTSGS